MRAAGTSSLALATSHPSAFDLNGYVSAIPQNLSGLQRGMMSASVPRRQSRTAGCNNFDDGKKCSQSASVVRMYRLETGEGLQGKSIAPARFLGELSLPITSRRPRWI